MCQPLPASRSSWDVLVCPPGHFQVKQTGQHSSLKNQDLRAAFLSEERVFFVFVYFVVL